MAIRSHKRKQATGEHENHERWLLTYADMITLLVAFFIMLYAMSIMNQTKFKQLAISVRSGFGQSMTNGAPTIIDGGGGVDGTPSIVSNGHESDPDPSSQSLAKSAFFDLPKTQMDQGLAERQDADRLDQAYSEVQTYIQTHGLKNSMSVSREERGVVVTMLTDKLLFAPGHAEILRQDVPLLDEIAAVVNSMPNQVSVEGHTDNLPIHTALFPTNWELSAVRATTVLRFLISAKVPEDRLQMAGYADQRPIAPNDTEAGRAQNRRVDIVILKASD